MFIIIRLMISMNVSIIYHLQRRKNDVVWHACRRIIVNRRLCLLWYLPNRAIVLPALSEVTMIRVSNLLHSWNNFRVQIFLITRHQEDVIFDVRWSSNWIWEIVVRAIINGSSCVDWSYHDPRLAIYYIPEIIFACKFF